MGVVRGQTEQAVGGGTNFRLVVVAARPDDGGSTAQYDCLVWGRAGVALRHLEAPQVQEEIVQG